MTFYRLSDEEYNRAKEAGRMAAKHGRKYGDNPYRGNTPKVQRLSRAWAAGHQAEKSDRLAGEDGRI